MGSGSDIQGIQYEMHGRRLPYWLYLALGVFSLIVWIQTPDYKRPFTLVLLAVALTGFLIWNLRRRLTVTSTKLYVLNPLDPRPVIVNRSSLVSVRTALLGNPTNDRRYYLVGQNGNCLVRLSSNAWDSGQLQQLGETLGLPVAPIEAGHDTTSGRTVNTRLLLQAVPNAKFTPHLTSGMMAGLLVIGLFAVLDFPSTYGINPWIGACAYPIAGLIGWAIGLPWDYRRCKQDATMGND